MTNGDKRLFTSHIGWHPTLRSTRKYLIFSLVLLPHWLLPVPAQLWGNTKKFNVKVIYLEAFTNLLCYKKAVKQRKTRKYFNTQWTQVNPLRLLNT